MKTCCVPRADLAQDVALADRMPGQFAAQRHVDQRVVEPVATLPADYRLQLEIHRDAVGQCRTDIVIQRIGDARIEFEHAVAHVHVGSLDRQTVVRGRSVADSGPQHDQQAVRPASLEAPRTPARPWVTPDIMLLPSVRQA